MNILLKNLFKKNLIDIKNDTKKTQFDAICFSYFFLFYFFIFII